MVGRMLFRQPDAERDHLALRTRERHASLEARHDIEKMRAALRTEYLMWRGAFVAAPPP